MASDVQSVSRREREGQEQQAAAGVLTNIPALGGGPVTEGNARACGCGDLVWDTEGKGGFQRMQQRGGGAQCQQHEWIRGEAGIYEVEWTQFCPL